MRIKLNFLLPVQYQRLNNSSTTLPPIFLQLYYSKLSCTCEETCALNYILHKAKTLSKRNKEHLTLLRTRGSCYPGRSRDHPVRAIFPVINPAWPITIPHLISEIPSRLKARPFADTSAILYMPDTGSLDSVWLVENVFLAKRSITFQG